MDRNLAGYAGRENRIWSLSARRAWIEMSSRLCCPTKRITVALRKESVDRNAYIPCNCRWPLVALRKESVDRNLSYQPAMLPPLSSLSARRAWIEITLLAAAKCRARWSLSARRAWIEISLQRKNVVVRKVALRKESVDRNTLEWQQQAPQAVALRKESVDRNLCGRPASRPG